MRGWEEACGAAGRAARGRPAFLCSHADFERLGRGAQRPLRMGVISTGEMRKRYGVLMDGDKPVGGQWNYDRQKPRAAAGEPRSARTQAGSVPTPRPMRCSTWSSGGFGGGYGTGGPISAICVRSDFGVTAGEAEQALDRFVELALAPDSGRLSGTPLVRGRGLPVALRPVRLHELPVCSIRGRRTSAAGRAGPIGDGRMRRSRGRGLISGRSWDGGEIMSRGIYWREMPAYAETKSTSAPRAICRRFLLDRRH